jgi:hypothetical protein
VLIDHQSVDNLGDGKLSFEALSYTWALPLRGANEPNAGEEPASCGSQHEIELYGQSLLISQNLYDAIGRLNGLASLMWIDAICINQTDPAERASQVLLMDEIYSKASRVIVWLGKDESDVKETLLILTHVNTLLKNYWDTGRFHPDRDKLTDPGFLQRINVTFQWSSGSTSGTVSPVSFASVGISLVDGFSKISPLHDRFSCFVADTSCLGTNYASFQHFFLKAGLRPSLQHVLCGRKNSKTHGLHERQEMK